MGVAEEEIASAKLNKAQSSAAFRAASPTDPLIGKSLDLYRAHAREICARVKVGAPLDLATDAECLAVFSNTSLIAPLGRNATAAMETLFTKIYPKKDLVFSKHSPDESWKGAAYEAITEVRRKFSVRGRGKEAP